MAGPTAAAQVIELVPASGRVIDVSTAVRDEARPTPADRPWVLTNMVATIDGATAVDGVSGGLGGPADRAVFGAIRAVADAIVVGAATVSAERYRPPQPSAETAADRNRSGQRPRPLIGVVTAGLSIDPSLPLFDDDTYRPLILTVDDAPADRRRALEAVANVVPVGTGRVDLRAALAHLAAEGHQTVLAEGGPSLNGQLIADDLVDEWNLTLSPLLAGGTSNRSAHGPSPDPPLRFGLDRLWLGGDLLFGRWLRP